MQPSNSSSGAEGATAPKPKPKFAPKIPAVKKEPTESSGAGGNAGGDNKPSESVVKDEKSKNGHNKHNRDKDGRGGRFGGRGRDGGRFDGRGGDGRGRGGGRGQWTMPLGPLFFSAGVGTGHTATAPTPSLHISGGGGSGGGNNFMVRPTQVKSTARPNEIILDPPEGPEIKMEVTSDEARSSGPSPTAVVQDESSDSDASVGKDRHLKEEEDSDAEDAWLANEGAAFPVRNQKESWPPRKYDPLTPISLPLGPKSAQMRRALQQQPVLAHPADNEGLQREGAESLFLLQLPSDLNVEDLLVSKQRARQSKYGGDLSFDPDAQNNNSSSGGNKPVISLDAHGKLGKLQLLKSGRVRMMIPCVTPDNGEETMVFEVGAGLMTSFYQALFSVEATTAEAAAATAAPSTAGASSASASATEVKAEQPVQKNALTILGAITRKLVITPPFSVLGEKKAKLGGIAALGDGLSAVYHNQANETTEEMEVDDGQDGHHNNGNGKRNENGGASMLEYDDYLQRLVGPPSGASAATGARAHHTTNAAGVASSRVRR